MSELSNYKSDVTSQDGENGIINELINRLELNTGWCVELGASDGKSLSNTWALWHDKGWKAVLIESNPELAEKLLNRTAHFPKVHAIEKHIELKGKNSLGATLKQFAVPEDFDLLSLDIDGQDYTVWDNLSGYLPKIVVIEFNETFPPDAEYQEDPKENYWLGSSAMALINLATLKGYAFVAATSLNLFFVRQDLFPRLGIREPDLKEVFPFHRLTHVISSFEGVAFLDKKRPLHIQISRTEGIKNQVNYRDLDVPDPYKQVVIISKKENLILIDILRLFLNYPFLLRLFARFRRLIPGFR